MGRKQKSTLDSTNETFTWLGASLIPQLAAVLAVAALVTTLLAGAWDPES